MKCRYCDREAVYDDGMCESCHRLYQQYEQAEAKVMSDHERDSFRGQTIEEDGTVRDEQKAYEEQMREQQRRRSGVRIITSGLSWRVKLAWALFRILHRRRYHQRPWLYHHGDAYLLGALVIYFVYNIVKAFLHR